MKRILSWLITVTALILVLAALAVHLRTPPSQPGPSEAEIATRIRNLQTITSTEYRYRDVIYFGEDARFLGILTGSRRILFAVTISVTAGVDLHRGIEVQFGNDRDTVFVTLPAPQVLRVDAEERSISQYFVQDRAGRLDWLAISDEVEAAKERNQADAINRGILLRAEVQARTAVTRLLQAGGVGVVHVRFRSDFPGVTG
ncbi:MAG: DUF4230 domain-containing protein [Spirochaetaceae bacterium]|nr:MAG: DUF4230 domain-containing protein [Spirochaetaceae bacterium]